MSTNPIYTGPMETQCAECGDIIPAYESRYWGDTGAVCAFKIIKTSILPQFTSCRTDANKHKYPNYYTDG